MPPSSEPEPDRGLLARDRRAALVELFEVGPKGSHVALSPLAALRQIAADPHRGLHEDTPIVNLEDATDPDTERLMDLITEPRALSWADSDPVHFEIDGEPVRFTELPDRRVRITTDTAPNRFVKHVVALYARELRGADRATEPRAVRLLRELEALSRSGGLGAATMPSVVSTADPVIAKDRRYSRILAAYLALARREAHQRLPTD